MKKPQRLCLVSVCILVLTTATLAGDIDTPKAPQPPPAASSAMTPGEIDTPRTISISDIALELMQTMLSVF